jgi:TetR/AcrR family transcriptional regulator, transcriptional repressor for nem operon
MSETVDGLLDAAEIAMRSRGYHGVSFRELADDVGIKSASVHYYFPQKEDLAVALIRRYTKAFFENLDKRAASASPHQLLRTFCDAYRGALERSERVCLCGMLGAESCGLPMPVTDAVAAFFEANLAWISRTLPKNISPRARRTRSAHILAALQGGMVIATVQKDLSVFDGVVKRVLADNAA